jgi:hypothetical protein
MRVNMQQPQNALRLSVDAQFVLDKMMQSEDCRNDPSAAINIALLEYGMRYFNTSEEISDEIIPK